MYDRPGGEAPSSPGVWFVEQAGIEALEMKRRHVYESHGAEVRDHMEGEVRLVAFKGPRRDPLPRVVVEPLPEVLGDGLRVGLRECAALEGLDELSVDALGVLLGAPDELGTAQTPAGGALPAGLHDHFPALAAPSDRHALRSRALMDGHRTAVGSSLPVAAWD